MKKIPLSQGKVALVDDEDFEWAIQFRWAAVLKKRKSGDLWYARRSSTLNGHTTTTYLHREIALRAGLIWSRLYDHHDGNGLNNRRGNIRPCTPAQNMANSKKRLNTISRFKGVYLESGRWRAMIEISQKKVSLGYYDDQESAALAYNAAALERFGQFARLNSIS